MLLDDFMGGFVYKLFKAKWERFGRRQHYLFLVLDASTLLLLITTGIWMKEDPVGCDRLYAISPDLSKSPHFSPISSRSPRPPLARDLR